MLVIEGRVGKSRVLVDVIKELCEKVDVSSIQIIDYVDIPHVFSRRLKYCGSAKDMKVEDFAEHYRENWKSFRFVEYLILELNAPKEMLNDIKAIENDFGKKIVVTIQNNDKEEIDVYHI